MKRNATDASQTDTSLVSSGQVNDGLKLAVNKLRLKIRRNSMGIFSKFAGDEVENIAIKSKSGILNDPDEQSVASAKESREEDLYKWMEEPSSEMASAYGNGGLMESPTIKRIDSAIKKHPLAATAFSFSLGCLTGFMGKKLRPQTTIKETSCKI